MDKSYVIAGDLGTSSVKLAAVDPEGHILRSVTEAYSLYCEGKEAEQDPQEYWEAVCRGPKRLTEVLAAENCRGLVFATQWRSVIPLDDQGKVLRRAIIWMDRRADQEAEEINQALGEKRFTGTGYWPKLLWYRRHEPELYARTAHILEANAFLKWKATGQFSSDVTNNYTRAFHAERDAFFRKLLALSEADLSLFPPLCTSEETVGHVTEEAAAQLHLPAGTPVCGGCCDIAALAIGTGCSQAGDYHAYLGTSGWVGCIEPVDPLNSYQPSLQASLDVGLYPLGISAGPTTQWMLDTFFAAEKKEYGEEIWACLDKRLEDIPAGSGRLLAAPFTSGRVGGVFINLTAAHTREHMLKAVFESYGYLIRQKLEKAAEDTGKAPAHLTFCGGAAVNRIMMQAMADILQIEIRVPESPKDRGAIGAALCALQSADRQQKPLHYRSYFPCRENIAEYELLYRQFSDIRPSLTGLSTALNQ